MEFRYLALDYALQTARLPARKSAANPAAAFSLLGYHRLSGRAHPQRSWDGTAWGPYWLWLRTGRAVAEPAPAAAPHMSPGAFDDRVLDSSIFHVGRTCGGRISFRP